ncbi:hypothetical protein KKA17_06120 [bacterium]|nr:hypothetical protein [bacterium]MBU1883534.1 hypothetical protein [bacterium]
MQRYKTYIAIDDTDELGYYTSTGEICEDIKEHIERYYTKTTSVTRHQLLLHEEINYTSHNSSMCFTTHLNEQELQEVKEFVVDYVSQKSASSSSPGICIGYEKDIDDRYALINYGLSAKKRVLIKENAFVVAKSQNLFLKGWKNEGNGVIGALAGVALRLYGNDGRIKGKITLDKEIISVKELLSLRLFDEVRLINCDPVDENTSVIVKEYLKGVYKEHKSVLLLEKYGGFYKPLVREDLQEY